MKQEKTKKTILFILLFIASIAITSSCSDKNELADLTISNFGPVKTRSGAYDDGYFAWDSINKISIKNKNGNQVYISLPWIPNRAQNIGIPNDWIDQNAESNNYEERYYSRNNGWRLVYSNLNRESEISKYFALYNEYTGVFRIFFYATSSSNSYRPSNAFIGMGVDRSSSLLNFTNSIAEAIDVKKTAPSIISSPGWTFGTSYKGIELKEDEWYGLEFECAYDPEALTDTKFNFALWTANIDSISGLPQTNGDLKGTITSTSPNMPNLSFDNSTTNNSNLILDLSSSQAVLTNTIDEGVRKNDSFFNGLWNNVSGNMSKWIGSGVTSGVKEGLNAVFTSNGSVTTKVLGNVVNSLFGGSKENVSKVDLGLTAKIKMKPTNIQEFGGGGKVSPFPLPGISAVTNRLYNHSLGVWNIDKTPTIKVDLSVKRIKNKMNYYDIYSYYKFTLQMSQLVMNPIIKNDFSVENFKEELVFQPNSYIDINNEGTPYALLNSTQYYLSQINSITALPLYSREYAVIDGGSEIGGGNYTISTSICPNCKVRVSFDLVNKQNGVRYSFSKYFSTKNIIGDISVATN